MRIKSIYIKEFDMKWTKVLAAILLVGLLSLSVGTVYAGMNRNFVAPLSGGEEVPTVMTLSRGNAVFKLSKDGTELSYKLIVANLEDVVAAHIHMGEQGVNGPVIVGLYTGGLIEGKFSGILAQGVISESSLGEEAFAELLEMIMAGDTYVNVHTLANPGGEIRGQIH
jgi:hypothetical protein